MDLESPNVVDLEAFIEARLDEYVPEMRKLATVGIAYYREWEPVVGADRAWDLVRDWHSFFWRRAEMVGVLDTDGGSIACLPPLQEVPKPPA